MVEYISRDKAREIIENQQKAVCYNGRWGRGAAIDVGKYDELETVLDSIDAIPAAEVEPVRRGIWVPVYESQITGWNPEFAGYDPIADYCCSVCGKDTILDCNDELVLSTYCPNCGARMDGGADNG